MGISDRWIDKPLLLLAILWLALGALALSPGQAAGAEKADAPTSPAANADIMEAKASDAAYVPPRANSTNSLDVFVDLELDQETLARLREPISLNFKNTELQDVVRLIGSQTGLNIVMSKEDVQGDITTTLDEVPAGTALESILRTHNLTMVRERGGIVRVLPMTRIKKSTIETKTESFSINWVRAERIATILRPFLESEDGIVMADEENNIIIVSAPPHKVEEMRSLIEKIDVAEKQVMIEARLCEITVGASKSVGINWEMARGDRNSMPIDRFVDLGLGAAGIGAVGNTVANARNLDLVFASPNLTETITQLVRDEDGTIIGQDITETVTNAPNLNALSIPYTADAFGVSTAQTDSPVSLFEYAKEISIGGQKFNLSAALDLLENRSLAKTLANPRIVTLNNVMAQMQVIRRLPYSTSNIGSGGSQNVNFQYEDIGITLEVTPTITNNNFVRMLIDTKQQIFIARPTVSGAPGVLPRPQVDERSSKTNVIVEDEATAVILGLRSQEFNEDLDAVPWVHRAPVLGWLFKGKQHNDTKNDLVAFVTPHIVKERALTEGEKARYSEIDEKWNLPDYFFDDVKFDDTEQ